MRQTAPARLDSGGDQALTLIEQVVRRENLLAAHARVVRNAGAPGVDGMTVDDLLAYCRTHWARIREQLLSGTYVPQPVRRVDIPKPDGRGTRTLGIPTVLDRFIQQALLQVLTPIFDPTFSDASFGFRPGRGAHDAVVCARRHIADGYRWVVDMDLEKFFDRIRASRRETTDGHGRCHDERSLKIQRPDSIRFACVRLVRQKSASNGSGSWEYDIQQSLPCVFWLWERQ